MLLWIEKCYFVPITVVIVALVIGVIVLIIRNRYLKNNMSKAYTELKKNNELLKVAMLGIGEAIIATDNRGVVTFSNYEAQKMFSIPEDQFLNKKFDELLALLRDQDGNSCNFSLDMVLVDGAKLDIENVYIL